MRRLSLALLFVAASGLAVACSACKRGSGEGESAPPAAASAAPNASAAGSVLPKAAGSAVASGAPASADVAERLWASAKDGDEEDLMALATHEGAGGLAAAGRAGDAERRGVALRAAPSARGYAHVPWLAEVAETGTEDDAALALDALADIGARVRRVEQHEDAEELLGGCTKLATLAKNADKPRARRIGAVRAVRTLPCPKLELPADLDAR